MTRPTDNPRLHVIVLAAGKGTRMNSNLAKVLHEAAGRPLVSWVLDVAATLEPETTTVVVGHQADEVRATLPGGVEAILQMPQNGTGHAAQIAADFVDPDDGDVVVVLPGDMPLISPATLDAMAAAHIGDTAAVVVSAIADDPHGYGRVIRSDADRVDRIVEQVDATDEQRAVREVNTSVYSFTAGPMRRALADVGHDNAQGEQYLTDVIGWLTDRGETVRVVVAPSVEGHGVNTVEQLGTVSDVLLRRTGSGSHEGTSSLR